MSFFTEHHLPIWTGQVISAISDAGGRGVDLFFVLSAYLITELLLREKDERGTLNVRSFYIRRILRIWPLYYLFVIAVEAISLVRQDHALPLGYILSFLLLAGNWGTIFFRPHVDAATGPLWSVSIEEQFYLLWPPLIANLTRRRILQLAIGIVFLANIARMVMLILHFSNWQIYFNTFARLDMIGGGVLLAVLLRGRVPNVPNGIRLTFIAFAVMSVLLTGFYKVFQTGPTWVEMEVSYPLVAACCTGIVYCVLGMRMESRWLRYLGKISYGLYVYHFAAIMFVDRVFDVQLGIAHLLLRPLLALGLTILAAVLSYTYLESPFLKLKRRYTYVASRPV